jgi:undecaprenyl-diphosphatase
MNDINYLQVLILALIQGAAELLPVSSTAHVIFAAKMMKYEQTSSAQFVFLMVMLHTGTMFAVIYYFWPRWRRLFSATNPGHLSPRRFFMRIALATACTGILSYGLKVFIEKVVLMRMLGHEKGEVEDLFKSLPLVAVALFLVGILIILSGVVVSRRQARGQGSVRIITPQVSILIGLVQGLCLPFRGFSRSGATISTALSCGIDKMLAEDFSFALAVVLTPPVMLYELSRLLRSEWTGETRLADLLMPGLIGMVFSFISGLVALHILSAALERGRWKYFGYYCIFFSLVVLGAALAGY